jgi:translation elongation factor EF-4
LYYRYIIINLAHIDHGKSTLAGIDFLNLSDRLLEMTDTIKGNQIKDQFLDKLQGKYNNDNI